MLEQSWFGVGNWVNQGDIIGLVAQSGTYKGYHLHFEVRTRAGVTYFNRNHHDPLHYLIPTDNHAPTFEQELHGLYFIKNWGVTGNNRYLHMGSVGSDNTAPLSLQNRSTVADVAARQWIVQTNSNGTYNLRSSSLINSNAGRVMNPNGTSARVGTETDGINMTITQHDNGAVSFLRGDLALTASGTNVTWAAYSRTNRNQIWFLIAHPTLSYEWKWNSASSAWFLYRNGVRVTNSWHYCCDGYWYRLQADGRMVTGRRDVEGATYFFRTSRNAPNTGPQGSMLTGWLRCPEDGRAYFLRRHHNDSLAGPWGAMVRAPAGPTINVTIDNVTRNFNNSGHCSNPPPGV